MATTHRPLRWRDLVLDQRPFHFDRSFFRAGVEGWNAHSHDFAEVYWCEAGGARRHVVNGEPVALQPGDALFMRAEDWHAAAAGDHGLTIVNLAFPPELVRPLAQRHAGVWPWRRGPMPLRIRLGAADLRRLDEWVNILGRPQARRLELEACLLDLARLAAQDQPDDPDRGLPPWLREALGVFADERHLAGGTVRLAELCGRSQAHINRVVRACQGRTATDLVNDLRLAWAATTLRLSARSIADIALSCGLGHLGHFYRLFQRRFGTTPRRYRLHAQR